MVGIGYGVFVCACVLVLGRVGVLSVCPWPGSSHPPKHKHTNILQNTNNKPHQNPNQRPPPRRRPQRSLLRRHLRGLRHPQPRPHLPSPARCVRGFLVCWSWMGVHASRVKPTTLLSNTTTPNTTPTNHPLNHPTTSGPCDRSFGVHVARLARFPPDIIAAADARVEVLQVCGWVGEWVVCVRCRTTSARSIDRLIGTD